MKELDREDWELVQKQVQQERRTILITLEINTVTMLMINDKLAEFPDKDEPKDKKGSIPKRKPSSYMG